MSILIILFPVNAHRTLGPDTATQTAKNINTDCHVGQYDRQQVKIDLHENDSRFHKSWPI